ncbi:MULTISPECIES: hypothetical protein [Bacillus cereus group]|uniref:Uncharacterized protein n=1 Tax=Bacillus toyonensis TaxID=155322 RepID=A0A2B5XLH1_9BACI|nr:MULTISPECIES: hypothetical protein [Bacillus cereus group]KAA0782810.1 hypothetical protein DN393_24555 [Bacillus sp. BPN334]PGA96638.1 hypothetical protein COL93_23345 [Bacillus toyonensis]PHD62642.1 hypothetical protein COF40_25980 [Bacillus toyonensis]
MKAAKVKRGEFYVHKKNGRVYQVLGYAKMFEHEEQDIIILKCMRDNMTVTLSAELFELYIKANKFLKTKNILNNLKVSL